MPVVYPVLNPLRFDISIVDLSITDSVNLVPGSLADGCYMALFATHGTSTIAVERSRFERNGNFVRLEPAFRVAI